MAEDPFKGDFSSIMVKADMIDDFGIAEWIIRLISLKLKRELW